jgi:hypothetical protein
VSRPNQVECLNDPDSRLTDFSTTSRTEVLKFITNSRVVLSVKWHVTMAVEEVVLVRQQTT